MSATKRLTLRVPTSLYAKLEAECAAAGSKINPAITRILKYSLGRETRPQARKQSPGMSSVQQQSNSRGERDRAKGLRPRRGQGDHRKN